MNLRQITVNTRDKKEYLNVLEGCKGIDGITCINIIHKGGIARHKIYHAEQDVKIIQKTINRVKRMPMCIFK